MHRAGTRNCSGRIKTSGSSKLVGDLKKTKRNQSVLRPICIGQDQTKKVMSVAVYNHYKRLMQQLDDEGEKTSSWWDKQEQENIGG
jgi:ATP-dependent protease Clp ATPase subunit